MRHTTVKEILGHCRRRASVACSDAEPARGVLWIEPSIVVEVMYSELMMGRLRAPVVRAVLAATR